jgi:Flp pilus assembly protein TadG
MKRAQLGSTVVEFALVLLVFLMFLLAIVDFTRMLFAWNAATEATRAGARYAVVCDDTFQHDAVLSRMQQIAPQITSASITWSPAGCLFDSCQAVTVAVTGLDYSWISPLPGAVAPLIPKPPFSTYLTREVMRHDPHSAAICS